MQNKEEKKESDKNLMLFQHPSLPDIWNYQESVKKMKVLIYKWKNLTRDVANELWIARENLSKKGGDRRSTLGSTIQISKGSSCLTFP